LSNTHCRSHVVLKKYLLNRYRIGPSFLNEFFYIQLQSTQPVLQLLSRWSRHYAKRQHFWFRRSCRLLR
jgi:tRNA A37 N6-isopentenylltransferase MiaA